MDRIEPKIKGAERWKTQEVDVYYQKKRGSCHQSSTSFSYEASNSIFYGFHPFGITIENRKMWKHNDKKQEPTSRHAERWKKGMRKHHNFSNSLCSSSRSLIAICFRIFISHSSQARLLRKERKEKRVNSWRTEEKKINVRLTIRKVWRYRMPGRKTNESQPKTKRNCAVNIDTRHIFAWF